MCIEHTQYWKEIRSCHLEKSERQTQHSEILTKSKEIDLFVTQIKLKL